MLPVSSSGIRRSLRMHDLAGCLESSPSIQISLFPHLHHEWNAERVEAILHQGLLRKVSIQMRNTAYVFVGIASYIDGRVLRPGIVLAELARECVLAELSSGLVDAGEVEPALPLLVLASAGCSESAADGNRTDNQVGESHGGRCCVVSSFASPNLEEGFVTVQGRTEGEREEREKLGRFHCFILYSICSTNIYRDICARGPIGKKYGGTRRRGSRGSALVKSRRAIK